MSPTTTARGAGRRVRRTLGPALAGAAGGISAGPPLQGPSPTRAGAAGREASAIARAAPVGSVLSVQDLSLVELGRQLRDQTRETAGPVPARTERHRSLGWLRAPRRGSGRIMDLEVWQELTTAIEAHETQLPAHDQARRVGDEELLLAVTLDRMGVVFDPRARGRWLVRRAVVEVDAEATRWVPPKTSRGNGRAGTGMAAGGVARPRRATGAGVQAKASAESGRHSTLAPRLGIRTTPESRLRHPRGNAPASDWEVAGGTSMRRAPPIAGGLGTTAAVAASQ